MNHPSKRLGYLGYWSLMAFCLAALSPNLVAEPATAPNWVSEAAEKPASFAYGKAAAAMLLHEKFIDVSPDGTFTYRIRGVTRILTMDGRSEAKAQLPYNSEIAKVVSFRAWLIRSKGPLLVYGKDKVVENAAYSTSRELYGAGKRQEISAVQDADEGSVFAWESVLEEKYIVSQTFWSFAGRFPVECSRLSLRLPKDWQADPHFLNQEEIPAVHSDNLLTWERRQLHAVRHEPFAPDPAATQPFIGIDIKPPASTKDCCRKALFSWPALAAFFSPLYDKAATPTPEMKAKADELVAGAATLSEKISRLCLFAQKTNYVSIILNAAEGGGMIPQPASKVFRCNYGDCKDKATFLRAMLRTQGIDSIPVIVHSGDYQHVHPEWPAAAQFNHCILAIKVEDTIDAPALFVHPKLGRFVIFDPTNSYVPFGILSKADSGGYGILLAGADGDLIQLPAVQPSVSRKDIAYEVHSDGSLSGRIARRVEGPAAEQIRAEFRNVSATDFQKNQKKNLQQSLAIAEISQLLPTDDFEKNAFATKLDFTAQNHGKLMRDSLLVFKPAILPVSASLPLARSKRTQPIRISAVEINEATQISLPAGFAVDEKPADSDFTASIGSYTAVLKKNEDGQLTLTRTFKLKEATLPAEKYLEVVHFAEKIREAEQSPIVLKRL